MFLLSYEALCEEPETGLHRLAEAIGSKNGAALVSSAATIRSPRAREVDAGSVDPSLVQEAHCIYTTLRETALR